ncbi:MAG: hypothetical protein ACXADF_07335 [Candidatus Thorarchaeota archaeon]|jgi:hypothetical protein
MELPEYDIPFLSPKKNLGVLAEVSEKKNARDADRTVKKALTKKAVDKRSLARRRSEWEKKKKQEADGSESQEEEG